MTVFVPADSKERSDESVIEFTVPIEAEATATGAPVAIVTSELAPGTPAGLQLSASSQSELTAPVHVDVLMVRLPYLVCLPYLDCHACPALGQRESLVTECPRRTGTIAGNGDHQPLWASFMVAWEPLWE